MSRFLVVAGPPEETRGSSSLSSGSNGNDGKDGVQPQGHKGDNGNCVWHLGGDGIKGTTNVFGGNSAAEFGPLLFTNYAIFGNPNASRNITNNFRQILNSNPCPA